MSHGHNDAHFHPSAAVAGVTPSGTSILDKGHRQRAPAVAPAGGVAPPATTGALGGGFVPSQVFRGGAGRGPQLQALSGVISGGGAMPLPPAQAGTGMYVPPGQSVVPSGPNVYVPRAAGM